MLPLLSDAVRPVQRARVWPLTRMVLVWLTGLVLLSAVLVSPAAADAPRIDTAIPESGASVTASPDVIQITFDDPVAAGGTRPEIAVLDDGGARVPMGPTTVDEADPRTIEAPISEPLAAGTYVVQWTITPDGAARASTGAYAFRVAAASIPGAATGDDALPTIWAIITRALTLLGLALSLGGFALARMATDPARPDAAQPRRWLMVGGAVLALIATLAEAVLEMTQRSPAPGFMEVVAAYPAWWPRTLALVGLVVVTAVLALRSPGSASAGRLLWVVGTGFGAVALVATSLATVSTRLNPDAPIAGWLVLLLQVVVVILAGVAVHLALVTPNPTAAPSESTATPDPAATDLPGDTTSPARRLFRWLMVGLAGLGVILVAGMSALSLSDVTNLPGSVFGLALIVIAILLVVILALSLLFRGANSGPLRGLAAVATLSLIGVAVLALSPPPGAAAGGALAAVNVVAPVDHEVAGQPGLVHLMVLPAEPGENTFLTWMTNGDRVVLAPDEQPAFTLELHSLNQTAPPLNLEPAPVEAGQFASIAAPMPHEGWWQVDVTATPPDSDPVVASFYLVLPDPNVTGDGPEPPTSPDARALFDRGLAAMTGLRHVQFRTLIGSGSGTFAQSNIVINDPEDPTLRTYQETSASYDTVIVGDQQWLRQGDGAWTERPAGFIYVPSEWGATYEHATGFTLGPVVEMEGESAQVVSFWLPPQENPHQEPAWFAWWVGTETGQVHRETMISTQHYMVYDFTGFNQPVEITPPELTEPDAAG